jgi:hypothetical protein
MPVTEFQKEVLRLLARNRDPNSFVAGGTVINRDVDSPRFSRDIDIFHDAEEAVRISFERDSGLLEVSGFDISTTINQPSFVRAIITRGADELKLDWAVDSAFRFFSAQQDEEFGYALHPLDLATNKVLAIAGRFEARDFIDVMYFERQGISLGLLAWAAAGKDPGLTPDLILDNCKRFSRMDPEQFRQVLGRSNLNYVQLRSDWFNMIERAQAVVESLPPAEVGCLYLDQNGKLVDPISHPEATLHFGSVGGAIPRPPGNAGELPKTETRVASEIFIGRYGQSRSENRSRTPQD